MEVGEELLIVFADLRDLGSDCVQLGGDGYYARDGGTEDGEDGAFAGCDGLEDMGREVLNKFRIELEAVPGFREDFCQEGERGGGARRGGR